MNDCIPFLVVRHGTYAAQPTDLSGTYHNLWFFKKTMRLEKSGQISHSSQCFLTGPTALIVLPVFLLSGYTLVQSVPITILVQFAVFLGVLGIGLCRSPGVAKTHETATLTQDVNLPDCKIWPACTDNEDGHPPPCVALIASAGNQSRQIAVDLAQQGYSAYQTQDADAMLKAVLACAPEWDFSDIRSRPNG